MILHGLKSTMNESNVCTGDDTKNNSHILAESVGSSGGISVALSPAAAQAMREQQPLGAHLQQKVQLTVLGSDKISIDKTITGDKHAAVDSPVESSAITSSQDASSTTNQSKLSKDEDRNLMMLPLVSISLERLVGYIPTADEDLAAIREQFIDAMWAQSSFKNDTSDCGNAAMSGLPPPDFDRHAEELFQNGMATFHASRHDIPSQTTATASDNSARSSLVISYPPSLAQPVTIEKENDEDDKDDSHSQQQSALLDTVVLWQGIRRRAMRCTSAIDSSIEKGGEGVMLSSPPHVPGGGKGRVITIQEAILHLFESLQNCNRGLLWKHEMSLELQRMIYDEQTHKEYQQYHGHEAREQRQQRISQLCTIRDALINQCHVQQAQVNQLLKDRDMRVTLELQRQRQQQQFGNDFAGGIVGGLQGLDLDATTEMAFPDEFKLLKLNDSDSSSGDRYQDDDSYEFDVGNSHNTGDEESSTNGDQHSRSDHGDRERNFENDDGYEGDDNEGDMEKVRDVSIDPDVGIRIEAVVENRDALLKVEGSDDESDGNGEGVGKEPNKFFFPSSSTKMKSKQKQRRRRQKAQQRKQKQAAKTAAHQAKLEQAKEEERELRIKYTTNDLTIALSKQKALERKLEQVEDLLESLHIEQEEDDEEEDLLGDEPIEAIGESADSEFSLLDQVLAMILGSLTPKLGVPQEEHYKFIQNEHKQIVHAWKEYFGRLPPAISSASSSENLNPTRSSGDTEAEPTTMTVEEQRLALGIVDQDDWEDEAENWEDNDTKQSERTQAADPVAKSAAPLSSLHSASTVSNNLSDTKIGESQSLPSKSARVVGLRPGGAVMRPN